MFEKPQPHSVKCVHCEHYGSFTWTHMGKVSGARHKHMSMGALCASLYPFVNALKRQTTRAFQINTKYRTERAFDPIRTVCVLCKCVFVVIFLSHFHFGILIQTISIQNGWKKSIWTSYGQLNHNAEHIEGKFIGIWWAHTRLVNTFHSCVSCILKMCACRKRSRRLWLANLVIDHRMRV